MKSYIVIGMTGEGKSEIVKQFTTKGNCYIFDVQNEYNLPTDSVTSPRMRHVNGDIKAFRNRAEKLKNYNIVWEEATGFFAGAMQERMKRIVLSKRHTRCNHFFIFHSIQDVPPFLFRLSDYVILHKTGDLESDVERKRPELLKAFRSLKARPPRKEGSRVANRILIDMRKAEI